MARTVRRRPPRPEPQLTTRCSIRSARWTRWVTWEITLRRLAPPRAETTRRLPERLSAASPERHITPRLRRPNRCRRAGPATTSRGRSHDGSRAYRERIHSRGVAFLRIGVGDSRLRAIVARGGGAVERCRARSDRAASERMGAAETRAARARARELPPMAGNAARGAAEGPAEFPDVPQSAARRTQASARGIAQVASASPGAARGIAAGLFALSGYACRSARPGDEALPAIRAASAGEARPDDRELASLAADDAGAAARSPAAAGIVAAASARRTLEERNLIVCETHRGFHTSLGRGDPCTQ